MGELITAITKEDIQKALPSRKNAVTDELVEIINKSQTEPEFQGETLLDSAVTYERVMTGRAGVGLKDYINALRFCAYLVTFDDNSTEAYKKTFYYRDFVKLRMNSDTGSDDYRNLTTAASRYRRSKTVVDILTYSQVPLDMMFTGARYKAVMRLMTEMDEAKYPKDRINAAKELLAATKGPEQLQIAMDVGVQETTATQNLMEQLNSIAATQKTMLEAGEASLETYGAMEVQDADYTEVEP